MSFFGRWIDDKFMLHLRYVVYIQMSISIPICYFLRGNQENEEIPALLENRDQRCVSQKSVYIPGLEIISGESPDTMTGQIHFSSVTYRFWPVKLYKTNNS